MRVARTFPNVPLQMPVLVSTTHSVRFWRGSSKFGWFRTLVKLDSNLNAIRSVTRNLLLRPRFQVAVPGPTRDPTLALPKRPMTCEQLRKLLAKPPPDGSPGQEYTLGSHHCVLVC